MEMTKGSLGFSIPVQNQKQRTNLILTPEAILSWRNDLPMSDMGKTANQVFHVLNDCNQVKLSPVTRFQITEILRTPVQFICQSLRKHYINKTESLTETQLTIARLAERLQWEMALSYKLILEEGVKEPSKDFQENILPKVVERLFHYFDQILLRFYHLYMIVPEEIWREVHLLFEYARENNLLVHTNILNGYKRILLFSLTDPYKWPQNDQDALHNACGVWAPEVEIRKLHSEPVIPTNKVENRPLSAPEKMRFLELTKLLVRIKNVVTLLEPNELQVKLLHSNEPEYLVPITVLQSLCSMWEKKPDRNLRSDKFLEVQLAAGLTACHYYLNNEKPFVTADNAKTKKINIADNIELPRNLDDIKNGTGEGKQYPLYSCTLVNENEAGGAGLLWKKDTYPPLQPGEIICLRPKSDAKTRPFTIAMIRWMKHTNPNELKLGTQQLAPTAKAGAIQIIKEDQNSGYFLRCLFFGENIVTPILPFKTYSIALLVEDPNKEPIKIRLKQLLQSTNSYKIFKFVHYDEDREEVAEKNTTDNTVMFKIPEKEAAFTKEADPTFDTIWSKL